MRLEVAQMRLHAGQIAAPEQTVQFDPVDGVVLADRGPGFALFSGEVGSAPGQRDPRQRPSLAIRRVRSLPADAEVVQPRAA
jgi:hypothetical protein